MFIDNSNQNFKNTENSHTDTGVKTTLNLMRLIELNQVDEVNRILENETINKNTISAALNKALHNYKANSDMIDIIDSLLNHGADPNYFVNSTAVQKNQKVNVLMFSSMKGDVQLIHTILKHNPNVNAKDINNRNALFYAIDSGKGDNADVVLSLIKAGVNVNEVDKVKGHTPLSLAAYKNLKNTVKALLDNNADPNHVVDPEGESVLHLAVSNHNLEIVKMLLEKGANPIATNKEGKSVIEIALKHSSTDIYRILSEESNRRNQKTDEIVKELVSNNGNVNSTGSGSNITETNQKIKKKKNETNTITIQPATKEERTAIFNNVIMNQIENPIKDKKFAKTEFLKKTKKYKFNPNLQIPFTFKKSQANMYIKIENTPILHIDLSDKEKENTTVLSYKIEEMGEQIKIMSDHIKYLTEENIKIKAENNSLIDTISQKDKIIHTIHETKYKEEQYILKINDLQKLIEDKTHTIKELLERCEKYEKELKELADDKLIATYKKNYTRKDFLEKKFSTVKYEDKYIMKCLQKDILDFQEYTKDQIKRNKIVLDELIRLVQTTVNEIIPDYEVKLYGSHATNLCLPWSDLDIVLINKRTGYSNEYRVLQQLYLALIEKPWKKTIKFIDTALIPLIKINSTDEYNNMQMDISLQDNKHYGIKCVDLVKRFMTQYEALEPLIFAFKNLLKNANLNDPYTGGLSSYGLILMVVSYLQSQLESNKPIKIAEGNLGRLFVEFLCYYGIIFDHTKYVIYTYPPNETDKDQNNFFLNMQSGHELIIVDPLNKQNNVGRSTYQFMNIKMAFMIGFVVSREECECGCHFHKLCDENSILNTEHCILKRIFNSVKRFNANVNS